MNTPAHSMFANNKELFLKIIARTRADTINETIKSKVTLVFLIKLFVVVSV